MISVRGSAARGCHDQHLSVWRRAEGSVHAETSPAMPASGSAISSTPPGRRPSVSRPPPRQNVDTRPLSARSRRRADRLRHQAHADLAAGAHAAGDLPRCRSSRHCPDRCPPAAVKKAGVPSRSASTGADPSFRALKQRLDDMAIGSVERHHHQPRPEPESEGLAGGGGSREMTIHDFDMARNQPAKSWSKFRHRLNAGFASLCQARRLRHGDVRDAHGSLGRHHINNSVRAATAATSASRCMVRTACCGPAIARPSVELERAAVSTGVAVFLALSAMLGPAPPNRSFHRLRRERPQA